MRTESGWFDFENCDFCAKLAAEEGLLEPSTWETHAIADGMMTIMTIPHEYEAAFARAEKGMNDIGMKIQAGELNPMTLKMCGHCQAFGMLMMTGKVMQQEVRGDAALVSLHTSDDEAIVAQLQDIARRNMKEMAMMGGHEHGHDHGHGHNH